MVLVTRLLVGVLYNVLCSWKAVKVFTTNYHLRKLGGMLLPPE